LIIDVLRRMMAIAGIEPPTSELLIPHYSNQYQCTPFKSKTYRQFHCVNACSF